MDASKKIFEIDQETHKMTPSDRLQHFQSEGLPLAKQMKKLADEQLLKKVAPEKFFPWKLDFPVKATPEHKRMKFWRPPPPLVSDWGGILGLQVSNHSPWPSN